MQKIRRYIMESARFISKKPGKFTKPAAKKESSEEITDAQIEAALKKGECILYGIPKGETDRLYETVLSTTCKDVACVRRIMNLASKDGWHSFRVWGFTPGTKPDFTKAIRK